jgi:hypothetical protein
MVQGEFLKAREVDECRAASVMVDAVHDEHTTAKPARASTLEFCLAFHLATI